MRLLPALALLPGGLIALHFYLRSESLVRQAAAVVGRPVLQAEEERSDRQEDGGPGQSRDCRDWQNIPHQVNQPDQLKCFDLS